jgi:hypothetical protein
VRSDRWAVGVSSVATIGKINIGMTTDTAPMKRGLQSAQSSLASFATASTGIGGKVAAALGVGLSVGGLAMFVKSSLEAADSTDEAAQRMGTTAGELAKLRYAAKLTGTETEALDGSLQKMSMILGKAALSGKGGATDALKAMGLSAKELVTMDPSAAFQRIVGGFAKIKNPAQQAAYAMEVFGRGGMQILNTLRADPAQFAALAKEAEKLGLAVTPDQVARMAAANDAMDRLGFAVQGLGNVLAVEVAPVVTSVIESFVTWAASSEGPIAAVRSGLEGIALVVRNFGSIWKIAQFRATEFFGNVLAWADILPENFSRTFGWLKENWWNLLTDMVTALGTFGTNLLTNASALGTALWDAIQGKGFDFTFTPLMKGFEATAGALPEMVKPAWVDLSADIAAEMDKMVNRETARIPAAASKAKDAVGAVAQKAKGKDGPKLAGLAELGSKEAYTAIVKAQAQGEKNSPAKETSKTAKEQLNVQRRMLAQLERQSANFGVWRMA